MVNLTTRRQAVKACLLKDVKEVDKIEKFMMCEGKALYRMKYLTTRIRKPRAIQGSA